MKIHRERSERGAAAVEFALVVSILFLLVFGIIEYGVTFNRYIGVTQAAREGVRLLALGTASGTAQTAAVASSPGLNSGDCVATTGIVDPNDANALQVKMVCTTTIPSWVRQYPLLPIPTSVTSTAKMRQE